jgi:hypothetical protein
MCYNQMEHLVKLDKQKKILNQDGCWKYKFIETSYRILFLIETPYQNS